MPVCKEVLQRGQGWQIGITNNRLAIVIEFAAIGLVGKEFFKEEGLCSWVIALGTFLAGSIRSSGMRGATAKAATKGSRVLAPVLGIRVRVNGKVIVSRIGLVSLEDGFGWAHKGTNRWRWWRWWRRRWWWRRRCVGRGRVGWRGRCTGNEGSSLVAAHGADGREVVVDVLGSISQTSEFSELEVEGGEGGVFLEVEGTATFVKAGLEFMGEVGEELLSEGAGPG